MNQNMTDLDPEDISKNISYSQADLKEKLQSLNVSFSANSSTDQLTKTFVTKLKQNHPIHQYLKRMGKSDLKDIAEKINMQYQRKK